jgi:phosphoglycerate dehydrogenase-like enzyme
MMVALAHRVVSPFNVVVPDDYGGDHQRKGRFDALKANARLSVFTTQTSDTAELVSRLACADVILSVLGRTTLSADLLTRLPALRFVSVMGADASRVDAETAKLRGIGLAVTPGAATPAVAEMTLGLMLASTRQLCALDSAVKGGKWPTLAGRDLRGQTLGLVGLGEIGAEVARLATAFGMNVVAWSPHLTAERAARHGCRAVSLTALAEMSDFVSLHLRLGPTTRGIFSRDIVSRMREGAYLVNTSRAALLDEDAVWEALNDRAIAGAALDVFSSEPLPSSHRWQGLENVVLMPHCAWATEQTLDRFAAMAIENIFSFVGGS